VDFRRVVLRGYPVSLLVCLHEVHRKNVSVDLVVSPPTSIVQVSLLFFPHFGQVVLTVGNGLRLVSFSLSIMVISIGRPLCANSFCLGISSEFRG
jgi:hypothetical protein